LPENPSEVIAATSATHTAAATASPPANGRLAATRPADDERQRQRGDANPERRRQHRGELVEHGEHGVVCERRTVRAGVLGAMRAAQRVARARPLRCDPQHRQGREAGKGQAAEAWRAPHEPQPVEPDEQPRLGAQQRGAERQQEGRAHPAVEVGTHGGERQGNEQPLGVADRGVAHSPRGERVRRRGGRPGRNAAETASEPEDEQDPGQRAGAGDEQPQVGSQAPEQPERRGEKHWQRLPGGAIDGR
jgi:hypothetical protein